MSNFIAVDAVRYTYSCSYFTGITLKLKERNTSNLKQKRLKSRNWWEADQLAIYKHDRAVELGSTKKQLQQSGQSGT